MGFLHLVRFQFNYTYAFKVELSIMKFFLTLAAVNLAQQLRQFNENCLDVESAVKCENDCQGTNVECIISCGEDVLCIADCSREYASCTELCPCYGQCYDGCPCEFNSAYCLLPDYNDDLYDFQCNEDNHCTLTMSDGQTFVGIKEDSIINFTGIPYAKPPTGQLRWKSPVLKTRYNEQVNATLPGFACATFNTLDDPYKYDPPQSEDCLTINIQVAEWVLKARNKVPIVAYIHGGSFNFGNNDNSLKSLATNAIATFNINYRLGPYGFLYLDEVEKGQTYKGNWGLQDQLAALKWIKMFGGVFGGDTSQVSLDGCSAGSQSVWHLLTWPDAWPYFHRVVSTGIGLAAGVYYEGERPDRIRNFVLDHANVDSVAELRQLSTSTLKKSFRAAKDELSPGIKVSPTLDFMYAPVIGNKMLDDHLVYMIREGRMRPNTPISWNFSKDDAWNFSDEAYEYFRDVLNPDLSQVSIQSTHCG